MNEKYVKHMYDELMQSVGEVKSLEGAAPLIVSYVYFPVEGRRAKKLWDYALAIGYVPASNIEPKFLRDRHYCFGLIEDEDDAVRIYPIRTEILKPRNGIDHRRKCHGKKHSK